MSSWRAVMDLESREWVTSIDATPQQIEDAVARLMADSKSPSWGKHGWIYRVGVVDACKAFGFDAHDIHDRAESFIKPGWDIDGVW